MTSCPIPVRMLPADELDALGEAAAHGDTDAEAKAITGLSGLIWKIVVDGLAADRRRDDILLDVFGDILRETTVAVRHFRRGHGRLSTFVGMTAKKAIKKHRRAYLTTTGAIPPLNPLLDFGGRHFRPAAKVSRALPATPVDLDGRLDTPALAWRLAKMVVTLPETEREIVRRRFGLFGSAPESLQAIGDSLGISYERVRQIESDALYRLGARSTRISDPEDRRV